MNALPKVAVIGTGGTISGVGQPRRDLYDYGINGRSMQVDDLLSTVPELAAAAVILPVPYLNIDSTCLGPKQWLELAGLIAKACADTPNLSCSGSGWVVATPAGMQKAAFCLATR